jgi:antitoxin (DNA-binding transcriptional repressor) of toxin-antitoxin stability system
MFPDCTCLPGARDVRCAAHSCLAEYDGLPCFFGRGHDREHEARVPGSNVTITWHGEPAERLWTTPARELAHATAAEALLAATARVAELTAVLRALAEVEPRRTECHGRRSYTRCSTCAAPPVSDPHRELRHEASCPWAQARALLAGREAEGGDHG